MRPWILPTMLGFAACATGSTFRSGVGDRLLEHPPYYSGTGTAAGSGVLGHVPIVYQPGAEQEPLFEPSAGPGSPVAALLHDMNRYLDSLGVSVRLASAAQPARGTPPDVLFSCEPDAFGDCALDTTRALGRGDIRMRLAVGRPSSEWTAWLGGLLDDARAPAALVITLEVGQYRIRQRGLRGEKEIELGTGYVARLPWLTSLETPVQVLQFTGALVGRDGRARRIGAEGLLARRTGLVASAAGLQALITDQEVTELRTMSREDLPGRPLIWQVALRNLIRGLTASE